ncbi:MAG: 50S ribosomal protein L23 [Lysobacterales bacterium]
MNKERLYQVLRAPHVSEKSTRVGGEGNQYVFKVSTDASKPEVKAAVEMLFKVEVENVNIMNVRGKTRSFRMRPGQRPGWKKAYVRLAAGQVIDVEQPAAE